VVNLQTQTLEGPDLKPVFDLQKLSSWAVVGIFVLLLVVALSLAQSLFVPLVSAVALAFMLGPWVTALRRWGIPPAAFAAVIVLGALVLIHAAIVQGSVVAVDWVGRAPELLESFSNKLSAAFGPAFSLERLENTFARTEGGPFDAGKLLQSTMNFLTPTIGELILFLAALFFSLSGRDGFRRYLVFVSEDKETRLRTLRMLNNIERDLKSYLAVVAAINFALATIVAVTAYAVGLPNPLLWGVFAFALEFIPYVGPVVIYGALFLVSLATFGTIAQALVAPGILLVADTMDAYVVTPNVIGRRMTLDPGVVFLALVFWTWLWGPVGALLATPLLIAGTVTFSHLFPQHKIQLPE